MTWNSVHTEVTWDVLVNQSIFNKKLEKKLSLTRTHTNSVWGAQSPRYTHTHTNKLYGWLCTSSIYSQVEGVSANNHECFHVLDIFKNEREMLLGIPLRRLHQHPPCIHWSSWSINMYDGSCHLTSEKPRTVPHDVFRLVHMFQCEGQLLHFYMFLLW